MSKKTSEHDADSPMIQHYGKVQARNEHVSGQYFILSTREYRKSRKAVQLIKINRHLNQFDQPSTIQELGTGVYYEHLKTVKLSDTSIKKIMDETAKDEQIQNLIKQISDGWP
ncbi:hypothetical protein J6590_046348 [Homalodisca vitripennis]|nr:hypothetical protein J6590_046348 [Homalodisca vitripennis]